MKPSSQALLGGIADTVETQVLPELEASTWTASRLRSCLALLRHLEQRVVMEGPLLYRENAELEVFFGELLEDLKDVREALPLRDELEVLRSTCTYSEAYPAVEELASVNARYLEFLDRIIIMLHENRAALGEARFEELRGRVMDRIREAKQREAPMIDAASGYSPI